MASPHTTVGPGPLDSSSSSCTALNGHSGKSVHGNSPSHLTQRSAHSNFRQSNMEKSHRGNPVGTHPTTETTTTTTPPKPPSHPTTGPFPSPPLPFQILTLSNVQSQTRVRILSTHPFTHTHRVTHTPTCQQAQRVCTSNIHHRTCCHMVVCVAMCVCVNGCVPRMLHSDRHPDE